MVVNADLEQASDRLRDCDASVLEHPLASCGRNGATILLHRRISSPRDLDDGITPPMVTVHQVENQFLKATTRNKEMTALLGHSHHIESGEVLDPAGIRDEPVAKGLQAQDDAPAPCHQLREGHSVMMQKIANEVCQGELQPQGQ